MKHLRSTVQHTLFPAHDAHRMTAAARALTEHVHLIGKAPSEPGVVWHATDAETAGQLLRSMGSVVEARIEFPLLELPPVVVVVADWDLVAEHGLPLSGLLKRGRAVGVHVYATDQPGRWMPVHLLEHFAALPLPVSA